MINFTEALAASKKYLASDEALASLARDPYWPKWNTPWWHMLLLHELGLAREIPASVVQKMVEVLKTHYLPIFPIRADEIPQGTDPYRQIACLCSIGNMYQVLFHAGVDVDKELPWMREWFFRYQLPDGGLNCDENAYTKPAPKSSIVTTMACLEAVFFCRKHLLTTQEAEFLTRGAQYLVNQRLFRKRSTGEIIDSEWLEIRFPRFYDYDFFRGYYFLAKWREFSGFAIPEELEQEAQVLIAKQLSSDGIILRRYNLFEKRSYNPQDDGSWKMGAASEFDLMKAVSQPGFPCGALTTKLREITCTT